MVAIIIFSHSKKLAEGLKEIIDQMTKSSVKVEAIGGAIDQTLGSNPVELVNTIIRLSNEDWILIFCDFGSTVLAAKSALKTLPKELLNKVIIVDAPIVEGAFAAAVEASAGSSLQDIIKAAEEARNYHKL